MNYDISNLATKPEDDMAFADLSSEHKSFLDSEQYWFVQVLKSRGIHQTVFAARARYYGVLIDNLLDIPF